MATSSSPNRLPTPGDVLTYGYLWSHESEIGREDSTKERPCVVVLAVGAGDHPRVIVAPITSRHPGREDAIALSVGALGLNRPSWIIPWELNSFQWPGPDVRPAAQPIGAWWRMGALTLVLRRRLREAVARALEERRSRMIERNG
jgi:mRNA-degrading endonuclease toxin of MazEF toxin-antitoxin module